MKIVIDGRGIINEYDGISRYSLNVIRAVTEADSGLSITVLIRSDLSDKTRNDLPDRAHVHPLPFGHLNTKTLLQLGPIVDSLGANLYHSLFCIQPLRMRTPGIITVHDTMWFQQPWLQSKGKWLRKAVGWTYHRIAVSLSTRASWRVIAVSKSTQNDFLSIWPAVGPKLLVIGEGVDEKFFPVDNHAAHYRLIESLGLADISYLLVIGSGKPYKNVENVLRAFAAVRDDSSLRLVMTGRSSAYTRQNIELANTLGLNNRFLFLGSVSDEKLVALLQGAVALVFPSLYEGFGLPVVEAMACGCPVITSNKGALREVAGNAALFVDPLDVGQIRDAIVSLAANASLRLKMKENGLIQASRFSWRNVGVDILKMYKKLA